MGRTGWLVLGWKGAGMPSKELAAGMAVTVTNDVSLFVRSMPALASARGPSWVSCVSSSLFWHSWYGQVDTWPLHGDIASRFPFHHISLRPYGWNPRAASLIQATARVNVTSRSSRGDTHAHITDTLTPSRRTPGRRATADVLNV